MPLFTDKLSLRFKDKIEQKPKLYFDLIYELLPHNRNEAEKIFLLLDELVKEKKLNRNSLARYMEEPLYFQENDFHDFSKRDPLIGKIAKQGDLTLFTHYLYYKYGTPLTTQLLTHHDIFIFRLPPFQFYIDKLKWPVQIGKFDKQSICAKYYDVYGLTYEMLGDVLQAPKHDILNRLIECQFDFNSDLTLQHLKQYFYVNRFSPVNISNTTLETLIHTGLNPDRYILLLLNVLWDEFSLPTLPRISETILHLTNFILDHNASLETVPEKFLTQLSQLLDQHTNKLQRLPTQKYLQNILREIPRLQERITLLPQKHMQRRL